jgi:hypothetical protein
MSTYRQALPQLSDRIFLTDGGIETTLIYDQGIELPHFAAFVLLERIEPQVCRPSWTMMRETSTLAQVEAAPNAVHRCLLPGGAGLFFTAVAHAGFGDEVAGRAGSGSGFCGVGRPRPVSARRPPGSPRAPRGAG